MADHTVWTSPPAFASASESDFRLWGKGISDALLAVGMKLVDSSQGSGGINWGSASITTGLTPTFTAYAGSPVSREIVWEIWRFPTNGEKAGGIGGTSPIYLRFGYGQHTNASSPGLTLVTATAYSGSGGPTTPGTGNLTSPLPTSGSFLLVSGANSSTVTANSWMSCDGNGLAIALHYSNATPAARYMIVIDRHRTTTGVPLVAASGPSAGVSTGLAIYRTSSTNTVASWHVDFIENESTTSATNVAPCITRSLITPTGGPYFNVLGQTELYPWWSVTRSGTGVSKMIASYAATDLGGLGVEQPFLWLPATSTTRTMKLLGSAFQAAYYEVGGGTAGGLALAHWWND